MTYTFTRQPQKGTSGTTVGVSLFLQCVTVVCEKKGGRLLIKLAGASKNVSSSSYFQQDFELFTFERQYRTLASNSKCTNTWCINWNHNQDELEEFLLPGGALSSAASIDDRNRWRGIHWATALGVVLGLGLWDTEAWNFTALKEFGSCLQDKINVLGTIKPGHYKVWGTSLVSVLFRGSLALYSLLWFVEVVGHTKWVGWGYEIQFSLSLHLFICLFIYLGLALVWEGKWYDSDLRMKENWYHCSEEQKTKLHQMMTIQGKETELTRELRLWKALTPEQRSSDLMKQQIRRYHSFWV